MRRRVGLLGHATGLYDELTVADNVRFWARAAGADQTDAEAAMERLGLAGRLRDVRSAGCRPGQRRRTSLAVMVARRAELWLLDEPHAGLDQDGRDLDRRADRRRRRPPGPRCCIASHELERAEAVVHRTVAVGGGHGATRAGRTEGRSDRCSVTPR